MNPTLQVERTDPEFARAVCPLLKEYTEKFDELSRRAFSLLQEEEKTGHVPVSPDRGTVYPSPWKGERNRAIRDELNQRLKYLLPPAKALARQASAIVEQGRVDGLEHTELWLRLAEFESALEIAQQALQRINRK